MAPYASSIRDLELPSCSAVYVYDTGFHWPCPSDNERTHHLPCRASLLLPFWSDGDSSSHCSIICFVNRFVTSHNYTTHDCCLS